jgi:AcrR family transcriptional regulator
MPPIERRAAIIRSVLPLLIEHGVGVTTRQIAHAAGVSEGTLFNVFDDKDELISAAVDAAIDLEPFEIAIGEIDPGAPFEERLVSATRLIQQRTVDIWKLVSQLDPQRHRDRHQGPLPDSTALVALFAGERDRLRRSPEESARQLRAMTLSLTHPLMTVEPCSADEIVDLFLNGVST